VGLASSRDALEESEHSYRDLFDHAQDVVYTTDPKMNITSMNEAGLQILGYQAEELVGRSFYELLAPADAARLKIQDVRLPAGGARPTIEAVVRRKDSSEATLEIVSRWITEGGRPVGVHGIGRDISERRERELATHQFRERVHQAEKLRALGEMAVGVAHNFNNVLMGVVGYAQLMESRARPGGWSARGWCRVGRPVAPS
jgi:PAS domain S-box-containing protein